MCTCIDTFTYVDSQTETYIQFVLYKTNILWLAKNILAHDEWKTNILALKVTEKNIMARLKKLSPPPPPPPTGSLNGSSLTYFHNFPLSTFHN